MDALRVETTAEEDRQHADRDQVKVTPTPSRPPAAARRDKAGPWLPLLHHDSSSVALVLLVARPRIRILRGTIRVYRSTVTYRVPGDGQQLVFTAPSGSPLWSVVRRPEFQFPFGCCGTTDFIQDWLHTLVWRRRGISAAASVVDVRIFNQESILGALWPGHGSPGLHFIVILFNGIIATLFALLNLNTFVSQLFVGEFNSASIGHFHYFIISLSVEEPLEHFSTTKTHLGVNFPT